MFFSTIKGNIKRFIHVVTYCLLYERDFALIIRINNKKGVNILFHTIAIYLTPSNHTYSWYRYNDIYVQILRLNPSETKLLDYLLIIFKINWICYFWVFCLVVSHPKFYFSCRVWHLFSIYMLISNSRLFVFLACYRLGFRTWVQQQPKCSM